MQICLYVRTALQFNAKYQSNAPLAATARRKPPSSSNGYANELTR